MPASGYLRLTSGKSTSPFHSGNDYWEYRSFPRKSSITINTGPKRAVCFFLFLFFFYPNRGPLYSDGECYSRHIDIHLPRVVSGGWRRHLHGDYQETRRPNGRHWASETHRDRQQNLCDGSEPEVDLLLECVHGWRTGIRACVCANSIGVTQPLEGCKHLLSH